MVNWWNQVVTPKDAEDLCAAQYKDLKILRLNLEKTGKYSSKEINQAIESIKYRNMQRGKMKDIFKSNIKSIFGMDINDEEIFKFFKIPKSNFSLNDEWEDELSKL